jgi:hypothetical protein
LSGDRTCRRAGREQSAKLWAAARGMAARYVRSPAPRRGSRRTVRDGHRGRSLAVAHRDTSERGGRVMRGAAALAAADSSPAYLRARYRVGHPQLPDDRS